LVPLSHTLLQVPLIWLLLRLRSESWASLGWQRPANLAASLWLGIFAGIALELLAVLVTTPVISSLVGTEPDYSGLRSVQGNFSLLLLYLALSWSLAGCGEEICFRGFLMRRLAQAFGESRQAWVASLVATSVFFGWGHTEQGISGWIQEGLSGLLLGVLFLATGRNLTVPIVAHGGFEYGGFRAHLLRPLSRARLTNR
jgi:uncharacterized protein